MSGRFPSGSSGRGGIPTDTDGLDHEEQWWKNIENKYRIWLSLIVENI